MDTVKIIFRKEKDGNIIAFFPGMKCSYGRIACYCHIGQHSEADILYYMNDTTQATEAEYSALLDELRKIYDDCKIIIRKRLPNGGNVSAWY